MVVYLTGSTGFIGSKVAASLSGRKEFQPIFSTRQSYGYGIDRLIPDLLGVDSIVHLAGIGSVDEKNLTDIDQIYSINVEYTEKLARAAIAAGVQRFVFVSSAKVFGETTTGKSPFDEDMPSSPEGIYAQSKYEAERVLKTISAGKDMELVIIRPPLVYGPGVKANFRSLLKLSRLPVPLPFGLVKNRRSMVYLENLVNFIIQCIHHPKAANQTFLVSDGQDVSLSDLIRTIRKVMKRPSLLLPVPTWLFEFVGKLTGRTSVIDRLVGDLAVDSSKARLLLDWKPPYTVREGIEFTVSDFINRK